MAALSPYFANGDTVAVSSDGVTATADAYGELLADGSTLPEFDIATEALMAGSAIATGATAAYTLRVLRAESSVTTDLETAVTDGTDRYFHITNRGGTKVFVLGPAKVTAAYERPPVGQSRGSVVVAFNVAGDVPSDFYTVETPT